MKTGIELIAIERTEQIKKHGRTIQSDVEENTEDQLPTAALWLIEGGLTMRQRVPSQWDEDIWHKMIDKPYKERLIIAGALIAAEIDRLQNS